MRAVVVASVFVGSLGAQGSAGVRVEEPELRRVLSDENLQAWKRHILPEAAAWAELPWLPTFHDGLVAAAEAGKPLLLWTMNGHPLGCT